MTPHTASSKKPTLEESLSANHQAFSSPDVPREVWQFTAEEAGTPVSFTAAPSVRGDALWKAQMAIEHADSKLEAAAKDDNKRLDLEPAAGRFHQQHSNGRWSLDFAADLTPGQERFAFCQEERYGDTTFSKRSYSQNSPDGRVVGYRDEAGAFEVVVGPTGSLTVFSELQPL